ncbi:hypothetical protein MRB53_015523 [Persea americana]|uniref:Uncharacterized protein n=1 Tax=Persea americana TaxID=3435 RepID=A0ACC2LZG4_PERAE|nr:hypothetical protein MRB53_015523 [Persea americana]
MSMAAVARTRSLLRSAPLRNAAAKLAAQPKPTSPSSSKRVPLLSSPPRFLRTPVEMSCCVESLLPLHSATASAVLSSMLAVSRRSYGWLSDAGTDGV